MIAAKRYVLECYGQTRRLDPPLWAVFDIALETAQAILSLSALVRDRGLSAIGKADTRVFYFGPDPLAVYKDGRATGLRLDPRLLRPRRDDENVLAANAQRLWVASYSFGFLAFTLSGSHEFNFTTETCSIAELAAYFDLPWDFGGPAQYLEAKFGRTARTPNFHAATGTTRRQRRHQTWLLRLALASPRSRRRRNSILDFRPERTCGPLCPSIPPKRPR